MPLERLESNVAGHHRVVEITYPQAEHLADLYGIQMDLQSAQRLCDHALELPDLGAAQYEVFDGLVVAALTKYMRCFASGSRLGLNETDVRGLSPELQKAHNFFKHLRDKHVAHPVNPLEETFVTTSASEIDGKLLPVTSLNPGRETIMLHVEDAKIIRALASAMESHIEPRIETAKMKLLSFLQSLPVEEVHKLDLHDPRRRHANHYVRKSRRQAKRSNNAIQPTGEDASG